MPLFVIPFAQTVSSIAKEADSESLKVTVPVPVVPVEEVIIPESENNKRRAYILTL